MVNCWEFKKCGREPGGAKADERGVCSAATERRCDGINKGRNGGRACWLVAGTLCGGEIQGTFASKIYNCMDCDFYHLVHKEQGAELQQGAEVLKLICSTEELVQAYMQLERAYRENRKIQSQLLQAQKLEVLGKVAAGVAHDLNTPLTGILSYAEDLIEELADNKQVSEDLRFIIDQAAQCRQIVRDLLDFSRKSAATRQPTSFRSVLQKAIKLVRKQPAFHNIEVTLMVEEDIPYVNFDPTQLQQVLLNLIINARDAMEGNGEITVYSQKMLDQGKVAVNIIDQGCGISSENVDNVFDAFYSTKGENGHGIGLATVRNIIEKNGGTISVTSNVGCGSCFRLLLPIVPEKKRGVIWSE